MFDMSGGPKAAKQALERLLDGVRRWHTIWTRKPRPAKKTTAPKTTSAAATSVGVIGVFAPGEILRGHKTTYRIDPVTAIKVVSAPQLPKLRPAEGATAATAARSHTPVDRLPRP